LNHPTNPRWVLFDPKEFPAPRGADLLLINEGGVLIRGQWYEGALAWGYKPVIPATVKARLTQKQKQSEVEDANKPTSGAMDPTAAGPGPLGLQMRLWRDAQGPHEEP
jgi:hypothetical protein